MPEATLKTMRNQWFHTGDVLRRDDDGWFYFVDRITDSIRRRGENISSYEVEQAMLIHDGLEECAALAVPADEEGGEDEILLACVRRVGSTTGPDDLWKWAATSLPRFAIPRYLWFTPALPKTPTERVRKASLRAQWNEIRLEAHDREHSANV